LIAPRRKGASQICNKYKYLLTFHGFKSMVWWFRIAKNQSFN
jgi:hypothetical protein